MTRADGSNMGSSTGGSVGLIVDNFSTPFFTVFNLSCSAERNVCFLKFIFDISVAPRVVNSCGQPFGKVGDVATNVPVPIRDDLDMMTLVKYCNVN